MNVDFLIVAALKDEAAEIASFLTEAGQEGQYIVGRVQRWKGRGEYTIAVVNLHDGMGALEAGPATQGGIARFRPRAVLLAGIAAGFEDSKAVVHLGDLMVPCGIVNYDIAKIKLDGVEHRGIAWAVSESLWQTAATTSGEQDQPWLSMMTVPRPAGLPAPRIHASADSVLGCGEKVVAAEEAEVRKWLLTTYPRQVLGLEMESSAVLRACRFFDTPFLVAKASVDKATVEKDDSWRAYACQFSAAFLLTVLQRYDMPQAELFVRHRSECNAAAGAIASRLPVDDFGYRVRTAVSFEQLRRGIYEPGEKTLESLMPNDLHPNVVLYGGGGAGKTTVLRRLFSGLLGAGYTPVLIDLKRYSQEYASGGAEDIDSILNVATSPRRTSQEVEHLAAQSKLTLLVDGVNEVSKTALASVLAFCQELRRGPGLYSVWGNRMTVIENLRPDPYHATLGGVPEEVAERLFDERFGKGRFRGLGERLRGIYHRPFFLDLAIRAGRPFTANRLWSGIFSEFFHEHLALSDVQVDSLGRATRDAIASDGKLRFAELRTAVGLTLWHTLEAAQVGVVDESGFGHHLWRDYLVARAFSLDQDCWTEEVFDAATTFGTSAECLIMAVEQIKNGTDKVAFVNAVYDWNYGAALECIAKSGETEEAERRVPEAVREAVLAVVAEKRFDVVERTRVRTERLLAQYPFAKSYLDFASRAQMAERVGHLEVDGHLVEWKRLYCLPAGTLVSDGDIDLIAATDSLVGWAAANFVRRGTLTSAGEERVRAIYRSHNAADGRRSVRWRAIHAMGPHPSDENLSLLAEAISADEYRWVLYGAARSLAEAAAGVLNPRRQKAIDALARFVSGADGGKARPLIMQEIVEACFVDNAARGWGNAALPLLEGVLNRVAHDLRRVLAERVAMFRDRYVIERKVATTAISLDAAAIPVAGQSFAPPPS